MRLACVKHAASVRSEPGSNSQVHQSHPASPKTSQTKPTNRPITQSIKVQAPTRAPKPSEAHCSTQSSKNTSNSKPQIEDQSDPGQIPKTQPINHQPRPPRSHAITHKDAANVSLPNQIQLSKNANKTTSDPVCTGQQTGLPDMHPLGARRRE